MKAVRCREFGPPDILRLEDAHAGRAAARRRASRFTPAGINFADTLMSPASTRSSRRFRSFPGSKPRARSSRSAPQ